MNESLKLKLNTLSAAIGDIKSVFSEFEEETKHLDQKRIDIQAKIAFSEQQYQKTLEKLSAEESELNKSIKEKTERLREIEYSTRQMENQAKKNLAISEAKLKEATLLEDQARENKIKTDSLKSQYEERLESFNKLAASIK